MIEDWFIAKSPYTDIIKKALRITESAAPPKKAFCHLITTREFETLLNSAQFQKIHFSDFSAEQIRFTEGDLRRLRESRDSFSQELGAEMHERITLDWSNWLDALNSHDLTSAIMIATKK